MSEKTTASLPIVLGLLTAVGLFAIDMYLPSLPEIGIALNADDGAVQASLISFFVAMGLSQLVYGPVSDMIGRKKPLYFGLVLFALGGVGCALAPSIEWLIAFRALQGVGACAGAVLCRAIVRDLLTGVAAAHLMSRLMLVFSVSPILAPLAGSLVTTVGSWRAIFWVMVLAAGLGIILVATLLPETRTAEARSQSNFRSAIASYGTLLRDPHYLGLVFIASFGMSSYMIYVANSSFVLIDHYGLSPRLYSVVFSLNAVSFIGASQMNGRLSRRFGLKRLIRTAVTGFALASLALFALFELGLGSLPLMCALLFVAYGFLGMVIPTSAVLALDGHGKIAGTASALMGTLQFVTASSVIGIASIFADGTALPMVATVAACATAVLILATVTLRQKPATAGANAISETP
ncbi:multidrug effflux MFS transporter [Rhizobium sp. CECT 9324]|jgi:DHA1 family bicyclomycin/chloramphenicol resistance-like MFS transporter|uniref:multidrug effflux MFS transporter n=1 Tax=Rhizobium sp. CECT 9324 TaxID=2845820 RepID=UPI001E3C96D7|nr:multidrug effflux MFS transporter [Rhizobium sp. CECT 9324]CAH0340405.1 Bicyclomycin resistance protein [Rhizobium sp. CECT 9324]